MFSNIYKGQTTGWYEFDKIIYGNASENLDPADGVLLGRYILLCYCETAFTEAEKLEIENETSSENLTDDKHIYWKNYDADGKISKDRMIYKKVYKDEKIQYIEIGRINEIKDNSLNFPGEKTPEGGEIFNDYENNIAGCKAYKILNCDLNTQTYTLENYQNDYEIGDIFSIQITNNYDYIGKIISINANNISVSFGYINPINNSFNTYDSNSDFSLFFNNQFENKYLWVPNKPKAGNVLLITHSHAEGSSNVASGKYSHAQGIDTDAGYCSHSSGVDTLAQGNYSMTSGYQTHARGNSSTAFGAGTKAYGENSLAIGQNSQTGRGATLNGQNKGYNAFAGGKSSIALGKNSFAFGEDVYTNKDNQIAIGKFNTLNSPALFVVGNGNSSNRSDAFQVLEDGTARIGKAPIGDMDVVNKGYVDNKISSLNPTVDLSGYMPLTGGRIINEEAGWAFITINPSLFKIDYKITGFNSFIQMGANKEIGKDATYNTPKYSGYITLANTECSNAIEGIEIPSGTFEITAIGVKGNDTAKKSWQNWLEIDNLKQRIEKLENSTT